MLASKAAARPERGREGECSECCCAEMGSREDQCGTSGSSCWGLVGSFLLALKGAEQLPQLFLPIIDAAWKGSGVLTGMGCPW